MSSTHRLLKAARLVHLYLGVFITPALIFFAFTGFVQTFSLHETTRGSDYKPPQILVQLGQLHKKQTLVVPTRKPQPPAAEKPRDAAPIPKADAPKPAPPGAKPKNLLPMKLFFALVSLGLLTSTFTGLYMSYKYIRNAKLITALLIAGILIPIALTFV
jgi:uncharacterized iron-regulated membrane protein